jgi:hypothetical protein
MKATTCVSILILSGLCLLANNSVPQIDKTELPKRDLTLIANPEAFPPSPADLAKIKIRVLKAEQAAAVARIAAIEARILQIQVESESRINALREECEALVRRDKEIGDALKSSHP